jgi:hypothetical protein
MEDLDLNPLTVLDARRFNFLAPHLETIELNVSEYHYYENIVIDWIETNLKGRYFYGTITKIIDNRIVTRRVVAFEDQHESSIFLLKCPLLGQK